LTKLRESIKALEDSKKSLEIQNSDLSEKNRVLEVSVEDLQHKLSTLEEEICFHQTDFHELEEAKLESENRLKQELTQLQAELAQSDVKDGNQEENNNEIIQNLEEELKTLTIRLQETEQQNEELNEELSRMADELMQLSETKSSTTSFTQVGIEQLQQQLADYQKRLQASESENKSLHLTVMQLNEQLEEKSESLTELESDVRAKSEAYDQLNTESKKRQSALELQLQDLNAKLNSLEMKLHSSATSSFTSQEDIVPETINPMSPRRAGSNQTSPMAAKKIDTTDLQMDTIYKSSPEQSPSATTSSTRKEKAPSSSARKARASLGSGGLKRTASSSLMFETSPVVSPHASEIAAIEETIDKIDLEQLLLESSTSIREATRNSLISQDLEVIRAELLQQTKLYEILKKSNAKLLQQVLVTKNSMQVCCRTRPPLDAELKDGGRVCVEVVDENEVVCYDRRAEVWRSFAFDKVWPATCKQVYSLVLYLLLTSSIIDILCMIMLDEVRASRAHLSNTD
jgi:myosin heavy subunit